MSVFGTDRGRTFPPRDVGLVYRSRFFAMDGCGDLILVVSCSSVFVCYPWYRYFRGCSRWLVILS